MNKSDYVVPIYYENVFNGNGFIIGTRLITAAHVVVSKDSSCYFLYNGTKVNIGLEKNAFFEYSKKKDMQGSDNIYLDLAVYELDDIYSPLELQKLNMDDSCIYQGYSDDKLQMDIYNDIKLNDKDYYYPLEVKKPIRIENTYIALGGKCKNGNSGGPLFQGNYVVGMLVGNQQYQRFSMDRYIKSDYISQTLSKL